MALADPQRVTADGTNEVSLPRVNTGNFSSEYLSADDTLSLKISTANGRRKRHVARLDLSKVTDDPFDDSRNVEVSTSAYLVIDEPLAGFTNDELEDLAAGLMTWLTASTNANLRKVIASES